MDTMNTYSGKKFEPLGITVDDVCIEDIAHALSLLCRGGGHLDRFYSVGQHSLNCAYEAKARAWPNRVILACLLHDASEAYISDVIRPVKKHLTNYFEIEEKIMQVIFEKFRLSDLSEDENLKWKRIDDDILDNELKIMMSGERNRKPVKLLSKPDYNEKSYREVEKQFIDMAAELERVIAKECREREDAMISAGRLILKPYSPNEQEDMVELLSNEKIKETFIIPDFNTRDEVISFFKKIMEFSYSERHYVRGIYNNQSLIGFINDVSIEDDVIELGYVIHPSFHNRGYATEALRAAIEDLFQKGFGEVIAGAFSDNTASLRVMEKCGMQRIDKEEDIFYRNKLHSCIYYSIKR